MTLALPYPPTDTQKLADWLEVLALRAPDGNSSSGDLERALSSASLSDGSDGAELASEELEVTCVAAFQELEARAVAAGEAYPFEITGALLARRGKPESYPAYVFCLCLSYSRWRGTVSKLDPEKLFEHLSVQAAKNYLAGEGLRFGSPRDELPSSFSEAIGCLCEAIGEGGGYKGGRTQRAKDDGLDVVAWRSSPDRLPGKVLLFGQCATGNDPFAKVGDLKESFAANWMKSAIVSKVVRAYFLPHRVEPDNWERRSRDAGMMFDRCRVAYWSQIDGKLPRAADYSTWAGKALKQTK